MRYCEYKMKFKVLFLESVDQFLYDYHRSGYVVAGSNGPHLTPETALRNSSHWIISLARAFQLTGDENYKTSAIALGATLLDETYRPYGFSFYAREGKGDDRCNGLIGQAWVIEALTKLHALTGNSVYRTLGIQLAKQHKFDAHFSVWHSLDIDGTILNIDNVFNHQLWFCATIALMNRGQDKVLNDRVQSFMDNLDNNLSVNESGLVLHHIARIIKSPKVRFQGLLKHLRQGTIKERLLKIQIKTDGGYKTCVRARDNGYHAFNTYAFAMLKTARPDHVFWSSDKYRKLMTYLQDIELAESLEESIYGFPYNPPGFEIPYALENMSNAGNVDILEVSRVWLQKQISYSYNPDTKMMDRNCVDAATQSARLYEAARFSDHFFEMLEVDILQAPENGHA